MRSKVSTLQAQTEGLTDGSTNLDNPQLQGLRGKVIIQTKVDVPALLAVLPLLRVHLHQGDGPGLPEGKLEKIEQKHY